MLDDRDYMRQPVYDHRMSFTVGLLIVNAIVFLIECVTIGYPPLAGPNNYFALSVEGLKHGFVWQLLTFQFMHAGLLHILLNSWAIYVFGRAIEDELGPAKFLTLFLSAGAVGGLLQMLLALFLPQWFGGAVVGASAGAFGLVAAYATLFPERELTLLLFFVIPIRLTAKMLLLVSAALAGLGIAWAALAGFNLVSSGGNIAHAAHLGGMLMGIVFVRQFVQGRWQFRLPARRAAPGELVAAPRARKAFWRSTTSKPDEELSTDEFLQNEVDPILEKISAHGIHSLTTREREILEKARSKMTKR